MDFQARLAHLRTYLTKNALDAVVISSVKNISYLSGFSSFLNEEREAFLLITKKDSFIFTSTLYAQEVKQYSKHMKLKEITRENPFTHLFSSLVKEKNIHTIGFESENLTVAEYQQIKIVGKLKPISLDTIRMHKKQEEIQLIKRACSLGDKAFTKLLSYIKIGITEKDIAWILEKYIKEHGATFSFKPIIAFGKNAAAPHHKTNETKLKKNMFILFDFGVKVNDYCSDMSRTIFFGKPNTQEKRVYQTVKDAQQKAIEYISHQCQNHTVYLSAIDKQARDYITSQGFPSIPHSLGHGIGIAVHEAPILSPLAKGILENGVVFSIEPGIYIPNNMGVRIEDIFALEENRLLQLTHSPKELIVL